MSELGPGAPGASAGKPTLGRGLTLAIGAAAGVALLAVLYVIGAALTKPGANGGLQALARGSMAKLQPLPQPVPEPSTLFVGADGKPVRLSSFHGRAVVLNIWATWCAPCKKEMPTLAGLQRAYAGKPLVVAAVSLDQPAQTEEAKIFIAAHRPLAFYQDARFGFMSDMKPQLQGFPTTVLIDRSGQERAVMMGEADWSTPEARAVMDRLMGE